MVVERPAADLSDLPDCPAWLEVVDPTPEDLTLVAEELALHPLAVEDAINGGQRPKVDEYAGHLFIVFFALEMPEPDVVRDQEISIFLVRNAIVTVRRGDFKARAAVEARFRDGRITSADELLYALLDRIVDEYFPIIDQFGERLELLERFIVDDPSGRGLQDSLSELFHLKSDLLRVRRHIAPAREVLAALSRGGGGFIASARIPYFQDVYDHIVRVTDEIDTFRDLASNVIDAHLAAASNRLNEVMKLLTSISTVLLVMTLITGFFGQNFTQLPFSSDVVFGFMIAALIASGLALTVYFRRRG